MMEHTIILLDHGRIVNLIFLKILKLLMGEKIHHLDGFRQIELLQQMIFSNLKLKSEMETNCKRYYLPHHPVVTPSKMPPKSANFMMFLLRELDKGMYYDCLYQGPITLLDLCGV